MKTFSFKNSILLINGVEISGFADGDDVIQAVRNVDGVSPKVGADGELVLSFSADESGIITINLMATSESNEYLSGLLNAQENGAFVPLQVQYKDIANGEVVFGTQGALMKRPDKSWGATVGTRSYPIIVEQLGGFFS